MNRQTWEAQFRRQLKAKLGIAPEEVGLMWRQYYNQRYSVEEAIAHLEQVHKLYPELRVLPATRKSSCTNPGKSLYYPEI